MVLTANMLCKDGDKFPKAKITPPNLQNLVNINIFK